MAPFIIHEPTDSPGLSLAERNTPLRLFMFSRFCLEVIVRISHLLPAKVSQRGFLVTNCDLMGSEHILEMSSQSSV